MLRRLERVLDLRAGELGRGLLLFAYLFFIIGSFTVGKAVRDALFIDEFGAMLLPYADMAIAAIVGIWVSVYLRLARRAERPDAADGQPGLFRHQLPGLLVPDPHLGRALADAGPLRLGGHVRRRRAGPGLDAGQLRADHARGQADVRLHRQRGHGRLDRRRLRHPVHRHAVRRRKLAHRDGGRAWSLPACSWTGSGCCGRCRRDGAQEDGEDANVGTAAQPDADCRLAVPARHRRRDPAVVVGHGRHRLAVQGGRRAVHGRARRAGGVLRDVQLLRRACCRSPCSGC